MPCLTYDPPDDTPSPIPALKRQIADLEAALCMTLSAFEEVLATVRKDYDDCVNVDPLVWTDFKEAGVSEEKIRAWWREHKKRDTERRVREAEKRRKADLKASALAKLSEEEKAALGIK
jgi:hypothetical protein